MHTAADIKEVLPAEPPAGFQVILVFQSCFDIHGHIIHQAFFNQPGQGCKAGAVGVQFDQIAQGFYGPTGLIQIGI